MSEKARFTNPGSCTEKGGGRTTLANDPAFTRGYESLQLLDERIILESFIDGLKRLLNVELLAIEQLVGLSQGADTGVLKASSFQANLVDAADLGRIAISNHERRDILDNLTAATSDRVLTNPAELMDRSQTTDDDVIFDDHVTCERSIVRKDDVIPDDTVVSDMAIREVISMAAKHGLAIFGRASMNGDVFSKDIAAADLQMGRFTSVFQILCLLAHHSERIKDIVRANHARTCECDMALESTPISQVNWPLKDTVWPDRDVFTERGPGINHCGGVDFLGHERI